MVSGQLAVGSCQVDDMASGKRNYNDFVNDIVDDHCSMVSRSGYKHLGGQFQFVIPDRALRTFLPK